jgi:hypothetical protein
MGAGDNLDKRGFTGAVFADKGVDFAGAELESNAFKRVNSTEGFGNGGEVEEGLRGHDWF